MNSPGLYIRGFENYAVAEATLLPEASLHEAAQRLILYFNHFEPSPQMSVTDTTGRQFDLYHDYEIIHLDDVRELFDINSILQAAALLLVAGLAAASHALGHSQRIWIALRNGAIVTLALLVLSSLAFFADFDWMFVAFHLVAFDNPFWQLNPYTDYLVMLFPLGFWQDMMLMAGAAIGAMAGCTCAFSYACLRKAHRQIT